MNNLQKLNVIFLLDSNPPQKIVMLKRAPNKKFAPNFYTGVGGKVEEGETVLESAYRELKEETGIENIELREFARSIIEDVQLFYFWGVFNKAKVKSKKLKVGEKGLPLSDDGELEWFRLGGSFDCNIIPSTKLVLEQWQKRNFSVDKPFTVYEEIIGEENGVSLVTIEKVVDGLQD